MNIQKIQETKQKFKIIGNSPELYRAIDVALQVASTDLSVLITGESGVGKEFFPQIIHQNSSRKHNKYIAVNCGAIPQGTIDSELFGHVKGSFTGATDERKGYFAEADKGTIFLDEIGEMPLSTQARLLRVLESGEYLKVGSSVVEKTNVRVVAATNVDLSDAIANGRFRQDLFFRLNTIPISVPSLRERPEDIELLFRKFAYDVSETYHIPTARLTEDGKRLLASYPWPGNIRQLKNVTEQISLLCEQREITADILREYLPPVKQNLPVALETRDGGGESFANEREILYKVLFELRRDVSMLKEQMNSLMDVHTTQAPIDSYQPEPKSTNTIDISQPKEMPASVRIPHSSYNADDVETVEESVSIQDNEKELIKKALLRNRGRRKNAAAELGISERTLYRKLKLYQLEDL
ncbi:MAG: sigma-54-dependent Fis family transcriptional regulator [Bacteroidaceae bacterium]|nr:sigma-54-dependent Fis family transcriptional regulator [Bacteroidaceae bacterium]MBR5962580.1 sigma-54-dependent Fis family transcriptional regulator [Bacteroidaceae bacterium]